MPRSMTIGTIFLTLVITISASCDKDSPTQSNTTSLAKVSGDGQTGVPGDTLPIPLEVLVTDSKGRAVSGQWLEFRVIAGNASLSDTLVVTSDIGKAETTLILGGQEGEVQVEAKLLNTNIKVFFTASASNLPPATIEIVSGNNQSVDLGQELPNELQVLVKNERNQPTVGTIVNFSIVEGIGVLSALSDTTNSLGIAHTILTLGDSVGTVQVIASIDSLINTIFTVTILSPLIEISQGNNQEGLPGEKLPIPLKVVVNNNQGIPFEGIVVIFNITEGYGALSISEVTTSEKGIAETWLTLGETIGTVQVTATVAGSNTSVVFSEYCVKKLPTGVIAFVSNGDIYTMNINGSNLVNLTNTSLYNQLPCWSPDGSKIAFSSNPDGITNIHIMDSDGSNQLVLTNNIGGTNNTAPSWSPDGSKIAFSSNSDGNWDIYLIDIDGSNPINLTKIIGKDTNPSWSSDGSKISFDSDRDGNFEIYIMDTDGSNQTRLTNNSSNDRYPSWSPDGSKIAFHSDNSNFEIYLMNADGSNQTRLTNNSSDDRCPSWSPDGTKIILQSNRDGNYDIFVMNTNGTNCVNITNTTEIHESNPSWSPILQQ